jgi:hypothetical protein
MPREYNEIVWLLVDQEASHIFFDPLRRSEFYDKPLSTKAVQSCPAVSSMLTRGFLVRVPFDLRLRLVPAAGMPHVHIIEEGTSISPAKLKSLFTLMPKNEWRRNKVPVVQISTPYVFAAGTPTYMNQRHPIEQVGRSSWRLIEGRFPIHRWFRPLSWAAEWLEGQEDIQLRRGEPWFCVDFECPDPEKPLRLVRKELTDTMKSELRASKDVAAYIKGTFSLFETAETRRQPTRDTDFG